MIIALLWHMALCRILLVLTNDPLPCLMAGVYLVLAPDLNLFLNSRKLLTGVSLLA